jgi:hypothetical protein
MPQQFMKAFNKAQSLHVHAKEQYSSIELQNDASSMPWFAAAPAMLRCK